MEFHPLLQRLNQLGLLPNVFIQLLDLRLHDRVMPGAGLFRLDCGFSIDCRHGRVERSVCNGFLKLIDLRLCLAHIRMSWSISGAKFSEPCFRFLQLRLVGGETTAALLRVNVNSWRRSARAKHRLQDGSVALILVDLVLDDLHLPTQSRQRFHVVRF